MSGSLVRTADILIPGSVVAARRKWKSWPMMQAEEIPGSGRISVLGGWWCDCVSVKPGQTFATHRRSLLEGGVQGSCQRDPA